MKTYREHWDEKRSRYLIEEVGTNIACPRCGEELLYSDVGSVVASAPPKHSVHCSNNDCDFEGYV